MEKGPKQAKGKGVLSQGARAGRTQLRTHVAFVLFLLFFVLSLLLVVVCFGSFSFVLDRFGEFVSGCFVRR